MAMACLMVGAKMEEQEPDIPVLSSVIKTAGLTCSVAQLTLAELKLLKAWEWNGAFQPLPPPFALYCLPALLMHCTVRGTPTAWLQ